MQLLRIVFVMIIAYLMGSIPVGLFVVKLKNGQDVRTIKSGRTGGTNAMRAAGFWAGFITSCLDLAKGMLSVLIARLIAPDNYWMEISTALIAIIGHNYSIFLIERDTTGRLRFRGGAGGATAAGGAIILWLPGIFIIVPVAVAILFGVGYASLATISIPISSIIIFIIRAHLGYAPWAYILYGIFAELIILWALRPNIKRLLNGTERLVGWRAKRNQKRGKTDRNQRQFSGNPIKNI